MTEAQTQETVQLPRSVVMNAVPMLFWVSQIIRWEHPSHQKALEDLYLAAAEACGFSTIHTIATLLENLPESSLRKEG